MREGDAARQFAGYAPAVAVEFGRKVALFDERPSFIELEKTRQAKR